MRDDVQGFEEAQGETPWCVQCAKFLKWPYHDECLGCLTVGGRPAETVSFRSVHYDMGVLHAVIRRKVAVWEQRHPGWELTPDMQRYWEDSTHPSKYVDRETTVGRKLAWTRFRVERRHPRGVRHMGQIHPHPDVGDWTWAAVNAGLKAPLGSSTPVPMVKQQGIWRVADPALPAEDAGAEPAEREEGAA